MTSLAAGFVVLLAVLRWLFFATAVMAAVAAALGWLVRTRRLNPFSRPARFYRSSVDPLLAPLERRVLRAGGAPSSAPWWALAVVVVGGIVLLSMVEFLGTQIIRASVALGGGPAGMYQLVVSWSIGLLQIALLVRVVRSWFGGSPTSPWFRWAFVLTEPILAPLRRIIPHIGVIDITPLIAYFALILLGQLLLSFV